MNILVADLGGTNCRFAFIKHDSSEASLSTKNNIAAQKISLSNKQEFATKDYDNIYALIAALARAKDEKGAFFLPNSEKPEQVDLAVFAVAGPVQNGKAFAPNMGPEGWHIDQQECKKASGIKKLVLINDFVAQAFACLLPETKAKAENTEDTEQGAIQILGPSLTLSNSKNTKKKMPIAVIGAGTGLGMCVLLPGNSNNLYRKKYLASEGGHTSFAFENSEEWKIAAFMQEQWGKTRLTRDDVVSGKGLAILHYYFYKEQVTAAEAALALHSESKVLKTFAAFYGRACRDYVLSTLALGALYIAGGVAIKNPILVQHPLFEENFYNCKAHKNLLKQVPIYLYKEENTGLLGAGVHALGLI